MSASRNGHIDENDAQSAAKAKRRKIRKGTHSCWECRQRKMKCTFNLPTDDTCSRCHRRGIKCVSQEYPEEVTTISDRNLRMGDRIAKVEVLVEQLLQKAPRDDDCDDLYLTRKDEGSNISAPNSSAVASDQVEAVALLKPLEVSIRFDSLHNHANC